MIRIGICAPIDRLEDVAAIGYDYIELSLTAASAWSDAEFDLARAAVDAAPIRAEAFNGMMPADYRLTGPNADHAAALQYLDKAFGRAAALGGKVVVFGSGGARRVPDRFPTDEAWEQLAAFLHGAARLCETHGITLVIEPLRKQETNILHTVAEGFALAAKTAEPTVGVLGDTYHMYNENEPYSALVAAAPLLRHVHTAENVKRAFPSPEDGTDYAGLFAALKQAGYEGRVSVEGGAPDFVKDAATALQTLRAARDAGR